MNLPFAHLNLRYNPFGEVPLSERGSLAVTQLDMDRLVSRLQQPGFVKMFLGDCGRGKTTHLLALREHLPDAPYLHFREDEPIPPIPEAPIVFLDELQRVPTQMRRKLYRRTASWVIGSHENHAREMQNAGLEVEVTEFDGVEVEQLMQMLNTRIVRAARVVGDPLPRVGENAARRLVEIYYDDIRAMEGFLYEQFQQMSEVQDVEV